MSEKDLPVSGSVCARTSTFHFKLLIQCVILQMVMLVPTCWRGTRGSSNYMRNIFEAPKSTPRLGLYIECGKIPLRYIIKARRLLYYWHVLHQNENELVYKFFKLKSWSQQKMTGLIKIFKNGASMSVK